MVRGTLRVQGSGGMNKQRTGSASHVLRLRDAFEHLDSRSRGMLERILFAGETCPQIACRLGIPACDVRAAAISAMRSLRDATAARPLPTDGNEGLPALLALGALDPDEAVVVERAITANPELWRRYRADRELVAEVCSLWPVDPPEHLYGRLLVSVQLAERARRRAAR
jgi:hypothetical protein